MKRYDFAENLPLLTTDGPWCLFSDADAELAALREAVKLLGKALYHHRIDGDIELIAGTNGDYMAKADSAVDGNEIAYNAVRGTQNTGVVSHGSGA